MHDPNPWTYNTFIRQNYKGSRYQLYGPPYGKNGSTGFYDCLDFALPAWERNLLYNMALDKLYEQLRGGLDLGIDIAEAGQTRRMLMGFREAEALARIRGSSISRTVANGWLEFQYGWRPLFGSLFGAANELVNKVLNTLRKFKVHASLPFWEDVTYNSNGFTVRRKTGGYQACTIACVFEVPGFSLDRFSSLNPVSLAWEVIPYSFVVDWFLDIGSFLRSLETSLLYATRFKSGYVSEIYHVNQYCYRDGVVHKLGYDDVCDDNRAWYHGTSFQRSVLSGAPSPRTPAFHAQLGWQRWISAGALVRQLLH
jgi:hypothetical protein